jgi:hypothetical protein
MRRCPKWRVILNTFTLLNMACCCWMRNGPQQTENMSVDKGELGQGRNFKHFRRISLIINNQATENMISVLSWSWACDSQMYSKELCLPYFVFQQYYISSHEIFKLKDAHWLECMSTRSNARVYSYCQTSFLIIPSFPIPLIPFDPFVIRKPQQIGYTRILDLFGWQGY